MSGENLSTLVRGGTTDLDPTMPNIQQQQQQPLPPQQQQPYYPQQSHQTKNHLQVAQPHCSSSSRAESTPNSTARAPRYAKMEPADDFPAGLRILVVDDDPICLAILQKMLQHCSYQVTTCGRAMKALELLREDKDKFDLVISDVYMPDMDGFKLLELVGLEMDLPVIMMSGNGETSAVMKGITHGACDYLLKPVRIEELRNIWQHVVRKLRSEPKGDHSASFEDSERHKRGGVEDADNTSSATDTTDCMWRNKKKKEAKEDEEDLEQENNNTDDPSTLKKPRVVWSVDLHQQFVSAVNQLGIDKAVPKTILELMNVHGLTRENVASHLQKYRLYLKRLSGVTSQSNNLSASFGGQDLGYGGLIGINEMLDYRPRVTNGHLPALHHANMVGRLGGASSGLVGVTSPTDPSSLAQIASLQSVPLQSPQVNGSLPGNQTALLQSLSGALDFNPLCPSHLLSGIDSLGQRDDLPSLKAMQQQLGTGSLGGSNRNCVSNAASEELTIQLLQQQRAQQQGGGSTVNLLPQATGILRPLPSDLNLGQAGPMANLVIPSTAIGLSNMCHGGREFGSCSSLSNASDSLIRSSITETQNLNFIGSSGSSSCGFQASVLSSKLGGSEDLNPTKRVRLTTYDNALSHISPELGQSSWPAWLGSPQGGLDFGDVKHGLNPNQVSLPTQPLSVAIASSGHCTYRSSSHGMGSLGMNFPLSLAQEGQEVKPSVNHAQVPSEQAMANGDHKFVKEERAWVNNSMCTKMGGVLISNETTSEELLNYYLKQVYV